MLFVFCTNCEPFFSTYPLVITGASDPDPEVTICQSLSILKKNSINILVKMINFFFMIKDLSI